MRPVWLGCLMGILAGGAALAGAEDSTADQVRSAEELYPSCLVCHGTNEMQRGPRLEGMPAWYVQRQLAKFQAGIRGGDSENRLAELMKIATDELIKTEEQRTDLAVYIESLAPQPYRPVIRGDKEKGRLIFQRCAVCHGARAQGNPEVKAPPLRIQEDWYLLSQLRNFKAGWRGMDTRDLEGFVMRQMANTLTPDDMRDVIRYIAEDLSIRRESKPAARTCQNRFDRQGSIEAFEPWQRSH